MPEQLSRRTLVLGGSALAFMAACGRNNEEEVAVSETTVGQRDKKLLQAVQAGFNFQTGIDERVTFALLQGVPPSLFPGDAEVKVAFQKPGTQVLTDAVVAQRKSEGIEERPYYVVNHTFDVAGNWGLQATVAGRKPANLVFQVDDGAGVAWPTVGRALPRTQTPTATATMGVDPICTRSEGTCPFHAASLDTLVGKNAKPTIVLLATPALCQSSTCGPVLDILMDAVEPVLAQLNVVHVEVFSDRTGKTPSPAFSAFKLVNEPVCYFADARGVVQERFNGAFDKTEAAAAVARLLA